MAHLGAAGRSGNRGGRIGRRWMWKGPERGAPTATRDREFASFFPFRLVPRASSRMFAKSYAPLLVPDRQVRWQDGRSQIRSSGEVSVKVNEASGRLMGSL